MGPRKVLYSVLVTTAACCLLLIFPKMDIESPGRGIMARRAGTVTEVTEQQVRIDEQAYPLKTRSDDVTGTFSESQTLLLPAITTWQEPVVEVGDAVAKRQLVAQGVTHIYFQANVWVFTGLVFIIGIAMGIGKAAVYKYIPEFYPDDVGVVGGIVAIKKRPEYRELIQPVLQNPPRPPANWDPPSVLGQTAVDTLRKIRADIDQDASQ